jgi:hypothetical protein
MKLYIPKLGHFNKNNIVDLLKKTEKHTLIYSKRGILEIINNKVYEVIIKDYPIEKVKIKEIDCLIDRSTIEKADIIYQIPIEHTLVKINKSFYKLTDKSLIDFVIEEVNHKIKDFYFIVKGELETLDLKEEIYTFLSIINNQII